MAKGSSSSNKNNNAAGVKKLTPFDFVKAISETKADLMIDDITEKGYNAFLVNRAFSYFYDTVLIANEMNSSYHLPNRAQYLFLLNIIKPRKRYSKWLIREESEDLEVIRTYYECNYSNAKTILSLLSHEQMKTLREKVMLHGTQKQKQ